MVRTMRTHKRRMTRDLIVVLIAGGAFAAPNAMAQIVVEESPQGPSAPAADVAIVSSDPGGPSAPAFRESAPVKVQQPSRQSTPSPVSQGSSGGQTTFQTAPATVRNVSANTTAKNLPFTGLPVGVVAAVGAMLLLLGLQLRRRVAE